MKNRGLFSGTVVLLLIALSMPGLLSAQAACDPVGKWVREDKVETIEIYRTDSKWFGKLLASTEKGTKPGFMMMRDFVYDEQKGQFRGKLVVPTSGMEASGEMSCTGTDLIRTTGRKLFMSKSFNWTRLTP